MEKVLSDIILFSQTASPFAVIVILVIIIFRLVVDKPLLQGLFGMGKKISDVQDEKYPELAKHFEYLEEAYANQIKFQENHSMHEIPAMVDSLERIENKLNRVEVYTKEHGERLARLEGQFEFLRDKK